MKTTPKTQNRHSTTHAVVNGYGAPASIQFLRTRREKKRKRATDLFTVLIWATTAMSVTLYFVSGGAQSVHSVSDWFTAAGIAIGLVATNLILIMLVLAARIPVIDRIVGQDQAIALHRKLGKPSLYLLLLHGLLLTIGYGISQGFNPIAETVSLFGTADMPLAYLGLGLIIVVVATSIVSMRKKFAYEMWHVIHLLSYAAVLVALPHQLSVGSTLAEGAWQRAYWIALYTIALGSILIFRFITPLMLSLRHRLRVHSVEVIAPNVFSIHIEGNRLNEFDGVGGQYAIWRFWSQKTWWHAHPISFSSAPGENFLRVTVRVTGAGTGRLSRLRPGTRISVEGPYGRFTHEARTQPYLAIIAAGIGVTPARALLEDSRLEREEATVLLRSSIASELYLAHEIAAIAKATHSNVYTMTGSRPAGRETWLSTEALSRGVSLTTVFPRLQKSDLYVCGPEAWTRLVIQDALRAGLSTDQIHTESFES